MTAAPGSFNSGSGGGFGAGTPSPASRARIGDLLLRDGAVTQDQLSEALGKQKSSGKLLGEVMVEAGLINSGQLVHTLAESLGVRGVQLRHGLIDPMLLKLIGQDEAERLRALPLFKVHDTLTVALAEPQSLPTIDRLRQLTRLKVRPVLALEAEIRDFIKRYAGEDVDVDAFLTSLAETDVEVVDREQVDEDTDASLDRMVEGSPIVNLVNVAMLTAIKDGASDLHIEPDKRSTRIRYRIDGVLRDLMQPPPGMHNAIVSRVKVIGKMDIAEKRLPQEGRVRLHADGREIDLRVSSMPTLLGEKLVVRVLDKRNLHVRMEDLGFRPEALASFKDMLHQPHGLVLVTGPTGSGKTTTLYSGLDLLRSPERNILTVEDPVEYQLDLVNQIQVSEGVGLGFAKALRSILRQDPDVIMIGEIRDEETARVAVQAALTGHLVLATLHTNDAPGAVARLLDMGIEPYLLSGALNGVVAQRLARTVCSHCKTKYYPSEEALLDAGIPDKMGRPFVRGTGCAKCHNSGMLGRLGLYEVMEVTPALRRFVHRGAASHEIREAWQKDGGSTLRSEGVETALTGHCSLEEILRVTQHDDLTAPEEAAPAPETTLRRSA